MTPQYALAESTMFAERGGRSEGLSTVGAFDLLTTIGVHSLVAAEVRKLRVRLVAHLTLERFHRRVNVLVLFQPARRRERLAAVGARV